MLECMSGRSDWASDWNRVVALTDPASIDPWCTSSDWASSAQRAFNPLAEVISEIDATCGFAFATAPEAVPQGGALVPLEPMWLFGAPVVGVDPVEAANRATELLATRSERSVYLGGYVENSPWWHALINAFGKTCQLFGGEERERCRASFEGGVDGYLSRRTRVFRRNLRQGERRAADAGVSFEVIDQQTPDATLARLHRIEQQSWKGLDGSGIEGPDMAALYAHLILRLHAKNAFRSCVAIDSEGNDLGFIFGGVRSGTYRGLQLSFTESARALGVGNLLQWHEIQRLCEEDLHTYDIGMDMEYKRLWTEDLFTTRLLIAQR
jgi:Acetyltransferase (GNAT) domain